MGRIFLSLLLLIVSGSYAQDYDILISKITDENDVAVPSTFGITEDSDGFIWFGTVDGLYRYDGQNMEVFRSIDNDTNSLSNNTIRTILYDSRHNVIWIGTQGGGLNQFDIMSHSFKHYEYSKNNPNGLSDNSIWALCLDNNNDLWIGMENNKLDRFSYDEDKFYNIPLKSDQPNKNVGTIRTIYNDHENNMWIGTDNQGLFKIDDCGNQSHLHRKEPEINSLRNNFILSCYEDKDNQLWIASYGAGLAKYRPENGGFEPLQKQDNLQKGPISNLTYAIIGAGDNKMWVGSEYGLSLINTKTQQAKHYVQKFGSKAGLTDNRIRFLFKDSNGIIWVGNEAGVDKIIQQNNFKIYQNNPNSANTLPEGIVRSIYKDNENILWIGLIDRGLVKYDQNTDEYTQFINNSNINSEIICYQISSIFEDSEDNLWIGDWEKGLLRFDRDKQMYTQELSAYSGDLCIADNRIQLIKEAEPGVLWLGTEMGVYRYNYKTKTLNYLAHDINNPNSLSGNSIQSQAFEIDKKGNAWIGTWSKGLNYLQVLNPEPFEYKIKHYLEPNNKQWLNNSNVISLFLQNDSILWVGTFGGGLNQFNINSGKMNNYDTKDGLSNNVVYAIAGGKKNSLWLSTDNGLSNFFPEEKRFHNYDKLDGLQDDHFFWGASHTAKDGELFFGGISGLNSFNPEGFNSQTDPNNIFITDIRLFNQPFLNDTSIAHITSLDLDYNQNFITLSFSMLNYKNSNKDQYLVLLDGLESNWNNIGKLRTVNYSNLAPGTYYFKVKVIRNHVLINSSNRTLRITIKAPWWKDWWAIVLEVLVGLLIIGLIYRIRINVLLRQKHKLASLVKKSTSEILAKNMKLGQQNEEIHKQKEELAAKNAELNSTLNKLSEAKEKVIQAEKMASLGVLASGVAHEINNPLNFIAGGVAGIEQHFIESNCGKNNQPLVFLEAIKEGISRTSAIVTSLSQFSNSSNSNEEQCNIHQIIDNCLAILSSQLKDRIEIIKKYTEEPTIVTGNNGNLHQVLLNILSNAEQAIDNIGEIKIETKLEQNLITISITDNGNGIKSEDLNRITEPFFTTKDPGKGTGLGLSVGYKIIQEHHGTMRFYSEYNKGTTVNIKLQNSKA